MTTPVSLQPSRRLGRGQEQIWASQRLRPDLPVANAPHLYRLKRPIDPARFVAAFDRVVRDADGLRTVIAEVGGVPHPRVLADPPGTTEVIDLPVADLAGWARARGSVPLDMATCHYDSVLVRHNDDDWSWYLNLHHVSVDAWAAALICRATGMAYGGSDPELVSLSDHLAGLADLREHPRWQKAHDHWAARSVNSTPSVFYADGQETTACRRVAVPFGDVRRDGLRRRLSDDFRPLSTDLGMLAALGTVTIAYLHRLGGGPTHTIGVPVHHRRMPASRQVVGLLMELFPLTITVDEGESFRELYTKVSVELFELLKRAEPGTSPRPDFDVVLNVITAEIAEFDGAPIETTWVHPGHVDPAHRLRVQYFAYDGNDAAELALDLNDAVADHDQQVRAVDHFGALLDAFSGEPDTAIDAVAIVTSPTELAALDVFNNSGSGAQPVDAIVAEMHRTLRGLGVDSVALVDPAVGLELGGRDVADRIDATAHWLMAQGIGAGSRVGIRIERSADAVVAVHAVLRAGAAFVPIDPQYPTARQQHIIDDAGLALVLDDLDDLPAAAEAIDLTAELSEPGLDDEAYVLYTSGSTGLPKGVPITHRGLAEYLSFAVDAYVEPGKAPVVGLISSLSFDLTITSLFLPFLTGGTMAVYRGDGATALAALAEDRRVTWLKATPSHLEILLRLVRGDHPLRTFVVGGEAFSRSLAERLRAKLGDSTAIYNEYGPTEAVVGCMIHRYDHERDRSASDVPIGRPAPGVKLGVFDAHDQVVPMGVVGELHVARPGLTTGYLNRADLNAERFVERDGLRWYRTGDLVRFVDGERLVYLGRSDDQVKVGGVRLEPAEVEAALLEHPQISAAAVRLWSPKTQAVGERCERCGLGADVPGISVDEHRVCTVCRNYEAVREQAADYFGDETDLIAARDRARVRSGGDYDVLHLLSGGKDSTYALYRLVELGFRVRSMTLDNGFISEGAKDNVRRAVVDLGVDHDFVTTEAMNEIFRDSLERFSNVCNGCYKTIYTFSANIAHEHRIPLISTGLSRGQFFETRLTPGQFANGRFDPDAIDAAVLEARKVYHRTSDAVSRLLDVSLFADDAIFEEIEYLDFYRYEDVELADLYRYLDERAPWVRPDDTGRSTNCLVNAAGIEVHKSERGFHSYALPYSWDVRLGHKTRDEATEELDDPTDMAEVETMLGEIGYEPRTREILTAWYQPSSNPAVDIDPDELRAWVADRVPAHALPAAFVRVEAMPLSDNGKLEPAALPAPSRRHREASTGYVEPVGEIETRLCELWASVLELDRVGAVDDVFDLGGTSLDALEVIVQLSDAVGIEIPEDRAFTKRTIRDLAAEVARLDPEVAQYFANRPQSSTTAIPVRPDGPVPLSSGQQALLYEYERRSDEPVYNVVHTYRFEGVSTSGLQSLDLDRLERAIVNAAARHEPLRTSFGPDRRQLSVEQAISISQETVNDAGFDALATEQTRKRFDLADGPLLRASICRLPDDGVGLILAVHHVSSDAASLAVLWRDIALTYEGVEAPELPTSYSDHASWQATRVRPNDLAFWTEQLGVDGQGGGARRADLALQRPSPVEPAGYLTRPLGVGGDTLDGLGVRPVAFFLGQFGALLQRYSDAEDVVVGFAASTRNHPDLDGLVGYFLTVLPLRLSVDPTATTSALSTMAERVLAAGLAHRHVPYGEICAELRRSGAADIDPARIMFVFDEPHTVSISGHDVPAEVRANGTSVADLTIFVRSVGGGFEVSAEWDGTLFARADIEELLRSYTELTSWAADHPGAPWASGVTQTDAVGPELSRPLVPLPRMLADSDTDEPAVRCGSERLTYRELNEQIALVGGSLAARGIGQGDSVGINLPRSVDLIVAILAVQHLGAAYVVLDPSYPAARLELLAREADTLVTISDLDQFRGGPSIASQPVAELDDPAYVVFTSGSTGTPKGISITHRQLASSTLARLDVYPEQPSRFLLVSSLGFDSSVVGLFWTLATGGELVLPTEVEVHDVDALAALIADVGVTHTLMVPTLYGAILDRSPTSLLTMSSVIVAGEACPAALVAHHHHVVPGVALHNEYGPSEATVWASVHRCEPGDDPVPIGSAIPGARLRVADRWLRPRPLGAIGELVIGGAGVARGYLDRPDETAARFLTDPKTGERLYRTGDLVRRRPDDVFEFVGRVDNQLELGGLRVEPEEIESALMASPGVTAAVVRIERRLDGDPFVALAALDPDQAARVLRAAAEGADPSEALLELIAETLIEGDDGTDLLVAHVEGERLDAATLTADLRRRLPRQLVPAVIRTVDHLDRTEHGKVDRDALGPAVQWSKRAEPPASKGDNASGLADDLTRIWCRILDDDTLDLDSDFFDSGGDSLLAIEMVTLIERDLNRRVSINALIDGRTPRRLAAAIDEVAATTGPTNRTYGVRLRPAGETTPLIIMPPAGGNLIEFDGLIQALDQRIPVIGFELPGADRSEPLPVSIDALCNVYLPEIRALQPNGPYRLLGWSSGGCPAIELGRRLRAEGETVDLVAMIDSIVPGYQRSGRLLAYKALVESGDLGGIGRRVVENVALRAQIKLTERKGRQATERGEDLSVSDLTDWLLGEVHEIVERHQPLPYDGDVLYFAAADAFPWRTVEPWSELAPNFTVVEMTGEDANHHGLLRGKQAQRIADELARRLV